MKKTITANSDYKKVSDLISEKVAFLSRDKIKKQIKLGEVKVNGKRQRSDIGVSAGDVCEIFIPESFDADKQCEIVYEDEDIVVFFKDARVTYDQLPAMFDKQLYAVHRLDRNTTGLIVFAKNERSQEDLTNAIKARLVDKYYRAVVSPPPPKDEDTLIGYHKKISEGFVSVTDVAERGRAKIVTSYKTVEIRGDRALLEVKLVTGKTHQIRAHLAFIKSPIVGDNKYGVAQSGVQKLCCVRLVFNGLTYLKRLNGVVVEKIPEEYKSLT